MAQVLEGERRIPQTDMRTKCDGREAQGGERLEWSSLQMYSTDGHIERDVLYDTCARLTLCPAMRIHHEPDRCLHESLGIVGGEWFYPAQLDAYDREYHLKQTKDTHYENM